METHGVKIEPRDRILLIRKDGTWLEIPVFPGTPAQIQIVPRRVCNSVGEPLNPQPMQPDVSSESVIDKDEVIKSMEKLEEFTKANTEEHYTSRHPCGYCNGKGIVVDEYHPGNEVQCKCPICGGSGVRK